MADTTVVRSFRFFGGYLAVVPGNVTVWTQPSGTTARVHSVVMYNGNSTAQLLRTLLWTPAGGAFPLVASNLGAASYVHEHPDSVLHPGDQIRLSAQVANTGAFCVSGFFYNSPPPEYAATLPTPPHGYPEVNPLPFDSDALAS